MAGCKEPAVVPAVPSAVRRPNESKMRVHCWSFRLKPEATGAGKTGVASGFSRKDTQWIRIFDSAGRLTALGTIGTTASSLHPAIVLI